MRLYDWLDESLATIQQQDLYRPRRVTQPLGDGCAMFGDESLADFTSNDYLGLANHPNIITAAREALANGSFGSGASALVSGRTPLSAELEAVIARFEGTPDVLLFPTGYAANLGTITALVGSDDLVFCDRLNHACLVDGCRLSRAAFRVYRADRLESLQRHLSREQGHARRWIVTEGIFGMDGTIAPLRELSDLADRYDAELIVDEAHATGVLGARGRGACEHCGVEDRVAVRTGTLSKAVGAMGGFVPGPRNLVDFLWNRARTQMFSTALPPVVCAAAAAAIRRIEIDPASRQHLASMAEDLRGRLRESFAKTDIIVAGDAGVPIVPVILGDSQRTLSVAKRLRGRGFAVAAIRPPTVPRGTARLRISLSAAHDRETVEALADALFDTIAHY